MTNPPGPTVDVTLLVRRSGWLGGAAYCDQLGHGVQQAAELSGRVLSVGSLRQSGVDRRVPAGALRRAGPAATRAVGRALWGRAANVHRTDFTIPPGAREVVSILDLAPLRYDDEGAVPPFLRDQAERSLGAVVMTEIVAEEVRADLGVERTWIVPPAVADRFYLPRPPRPVGPDYVLHVGGASARKGLGQLARAWPDVARCHRDVELVLAGPPHPSGRAPVLELPGTRYVGQPDDDTLLALMAHARAVVVPSTYEGFGMPVAEAMALGTPVVVVGGTAAAEVGAGFAIEAAAADGASGLGAALAAAITARDDDAPGLAAGARHAQRWRAAESQRRQVAAYQDAFAH